MSLKPTMKEEVADVRADSVAADAAIVGGATSAADTLVEIEALLALKAPLASPTFTGVPAAPLAGAGTNTTQLATTSFVKQEIDLKVVAAPAAANSAGVTGQIASADGFAYFCVAANTWQRVAIATW